MPSNTGTPSKVSQVQAHLQSTRSFALVPPTPAQVANYNKALQANPQAKYNGYYLQYATQLLGTVQGYYVYLASIPAHYVQGLLVTPAQTLYIAQKLYTTGTYTNPLYAGTLQGVQQAILQNMAWGAAMRRANYGVWQMQLPPHLHPQRNVGLPG